MLRGGRLLSSWRLGSRAFAADAGATTDWNDFNNVAKELRRIAREQGIGRAVPDTKTLKELGHNDLIMAIRKKHGGFVAVAEGPRALRGAGTPVAAAPNAGHLPSIITRCGFVIATHPNPFIIGRSAWTAFLVSSRRRSHFVLTSVQHNLPEAEQHMHLTTLDANARAQYVTNVLKLLHKIEFLVLVEFTEVIIPFVYFTWRFYRRNTTRKLTCPCVAVYLYAMFLLPNHVYHTQLRNMDASEHRRTLGNVLAYASLELMSLLVFQTLINRKIQISLAHQLAFVLEKHWTLVQLKLCV
ncbi:hypothetical protein Poli38472_005225 [Pythium oligandrum]|uniref:Uncharacterized protein n=1 Tax=Pythium oligandrum TaxID=41045 RepID=A0A8K1CI86_PYTOL|nr:hypothetical protein Poli38472_005225 [Pythium oligandrum]|eukprot:TMW62607.1 hypothetical protein Poli38472_005225 [Pythium oligandrum]